MSVIGSNILAGASGQGGYFIDRSLRFRSSASAYLSRTLGANGNKKLFTYSVWVKRSGWATSMPFGPSVYVSGGDFALLALTNTGEISFSAYNGAWVVQLVTTAKYRDPSAWMHIVLVWDTAQATVANRAKIYVNGVEVTAFSTATYPALNADIYRLQNSGQTLVYRYATSSLDGYITEVNFIDGQALDPTDFGETDSVTGVWKPKKYTGTYGTNGFYLNFSDNSSTTTLGEDGSGNGNDWTLNNFSLTSGSTYDSMTDVPTLTSETAANYATLNPLDQAGTLSSGNLEISTTSASWKQARGTIGINSGKWYWETTLVSGTNYMTGISKSTGGSTYPGANADGWGYAGGASGTLYNNGSGSSYGAGYTAGDVIGIALDLDAGTLTFYKNGSSQGQAASGLTGTWFPSVAVYASSGTTKWAFNVGQLPFAYTPPTGFKALNTYNLPDSTVADGNDYFNTVLYTGNGTSQSLSAGFASDFVWVKNRSTANSHQLTDIVRGNTNALASDLTIAEYTGEISLTSSGFSVSGNANATNKASQTYVGWTWKANGSGVSNTDGSITSTVSANTTAGFSIVTYTGTGANATVGHGLGAAPSMVIVKGRLINYGGGIGGDWIVWHNALSATERLYLNYTNATATGQTTTWNSTLPSASVVSLGNNLHVNYDSSSTYVMYCFAEVEGFSKMGSYIGNGSTTGDGTFVYTGFRPAWVLIKQSSISGNNWVIYDAVRDAYNECDSVLYPNLSNAEFSGTTVNLDLLSNGFKARDNWGAINTSGETYIYIAFAENPFKNSLAR